MTQYQFFLIPLEGAGGAVEDLNRFLRGHRVVTVDRRLVERDGGPVWAFCVEYLESAVAGGGRSDIRIDYRELLPPEQFERFSRLRVLRKQLAEKESVPPYAIFTNEQLAAMSAQEQPTLDGFRSIAGVGEAKTAKYGALFVQALLGFAKQARSWSFRRAVLEDLGRRSKGLEPRDPWWQLEQRRPELPVREPEQQRPVEPQQQPRVAPGPSSDQRQQANGTEPTAVRSTVHRVGGECETGPPGVSRHPQGRSNAPGAPSWRGPGLRPAGATGFKRPTPKIPELVVRVRPKLRGTFDGRRRN